MNTDKETVFHIFLATEETIRPKVIIKQWGASDVFYTLDEAVAAGVKALDERFAELQEFFSDHWSKDDIAEDVGYQFIIYEYNPGVARREDGWWEEFVRWHFNHKGILRERIENKAIRKGDNVDFYSTVRFPGDEADDAGCKFNVGDFVTVANDENELIYVVSHAPGKRENWPKRFLIMSSSPIDNQPESGENFYTVDGFDSNGLFTHAHPHESKLCRYEDAIPQDHPLQILKKHYLGVITIDDDMFDDIFSRRIIFDYPPKTRSWHTIPELMDMVKK
ncbi:MAG: hypothetical protein FWE83_10975 [Oscillospiraceae bacterium]|nr:hypothetical protein [Oscillospiraceae bacterium]